MGGGQQANPAQDSWQQYQQQQTYKDLGNTVSQGFQRAGAGLAGANSGLSGQVAGVGQQAGYAPTPQAGPSYGASGPLFAQQGGGGGIDQQKLAQILQALGYGG